MSTVTNHLPGTSSLSRAVHAALANVIQDPIVTATGSTDNNQTTMIAASGDSLSMKNLNTCENCSKLRQQLTLLIYEVLNLENTMESKICEYVQRRLSEIALTENIKQIDSNNNGFVSFLSRSNSPIFPLRSILRFVIK